MYIYIYMYIYIWRRVSRCHAVERRSLVGASGDFIYSSQFSVVYHMMWSIVFNSKQHANSNAFWIYVRLSYFCPKPMVTRVPRIFEALFVIVEWCISLRSLGQAGWILLVYRYRKGLPYLTCKELFFSTMVEMLFSCGMGPSLQMAYVGLEHQFCMQRNMNSG